jgi:Ca2+-binding RTX toxin-like protein
MPSVTPIGAENLVNTSTAGDQIFTRITSLSNGGYVVTWTSPAMGGIINNPNFAAADIYARIYNADGTPAGAEFVVNNLIGGAQLFSDVVELSDGNLLFTWQDGIGQFFGGPSVAPSTFMAREFTASGSAVGSQFDIGGAASGAAFFDVTPIAGGGFVAVWQSGTNSIVVGQRFDNNNVAGTQFVIDSNPPFIAGPRVVTLADGNIVAAWQVNGPPNLGAYQVFTSEGVPVSSQIFIPGTPANFMELVALTNGGFAISYLSTVGAAQQSRVRLLLPDGSFGADELLAIGQNFNTEVASLAPLPNGGLAATWSQESLPGQPNDVYLQLLGAIGTPLGAPIVASTNIIGAQNSIDVAVLTNGDLVLSWADNSGLGGDADGFGIQTRRFDVDYSNGAPTATDDIFTTESGLVVLSETDLTDNDDDPDGDILRVTSVSNVIGGTVTLVTAPLGNTIQIDRPAGYSGPISFDYTVTDGQGGSDTGNAIASLSRDDMITVRGVSPVTIDFLANDYLQPRTDGYSFSIFGTQTGAQIVGSGLSSQILYQVLATPQGSTYFTLPVGQTLQSFITYNVTNPVTGLTDYSATIAVTLQGWTQFGGTGADTLTGGAQADHLIGGTGAANILAGGAGDDFYTVSVAGDQVIELLGEGIDTIRSALSVYVLPDNVENLNAAITGLNGTGNALNNLIGGSSGVDQLFGLGGNDSLFGSNGDDILNGGAGNDRLNGGNNLDTASYINAAGAAYIELGAGFALETASTAGTVGASDAVISQDVLQLIENVIGTSFGDRIYGTAIDNVLGGGDGSDILYGEAGTDTVDFSANTGAIFLDLAGNYATETALTAGTVNAVTGVLSTDYLYSFENTNGSAFGDRLYGTSGVNVINGGSGDDIIYGNEGQDTLNGGDGDDFIVGGEGRDTMSGGSGADRFYFSTAPEITTGPPGAWDVISDFTSGSDRIYISRAAFGLSPLDTIILNGPPGPFPSFSFSGTLLSIDLDGFAPGAAIGIVEFIGPMPASLLSSDIVLY